MYSFLKKILHSRSKKITKRDSIVDINAINQLVNKEMFDEANTMLLNVFKKNPNVNLACELARIALRQKNPHEAKKYLEQYVHKTNPNLRSLVLMGRSCEKLQDYHQANEFYNRALLKNPKSDGAIKGLERIKFVLQGLNLRNVFSEHLCHVERYIEKGSIQLAVAEANKLKKYQNLISNLPWHDDDLYAKVAHFVFQYDMHNAVNSFNSELISISVEYGYLTWPKKIQKFIINKSVLDVGCGFGGYGTGFLVAGAKNYTGLDPAIELDSLKAKNKRIRKWMSFPKTPRQIMDSNDQITIVNGKAEDIRHHRKYDVISLHNVTEHLTEIERAFSGFLSLMKDETKIVWLHHHFYGWNGHHQKPVRVEDYDENNDEHKKYADWAHVIFGGSYPPDNYINSKLNQISLEKLKGITEKYFKIIEWKENYSKQIVLNRLTPDLIKKALKARPDISEKDLKIHSVFCSSKGKL